MLTLANFLPLLIFVCNLASGAIGGNKLGGLYQLKVKGKR